MQDACSRQRVDGRGHKSKAERPGEAVHCETLRKKLVTIYVSMIALVNKLVLNI